MSVLLLLLCVHSVCVCVCSVVENSPLLVLFVNIRVCLCFKYSN